LVKAHLGRLTCADVPVAAVLSGPG